MEMQNVNTVDLNKLQESLLIAFVYHAEGRRFSLVSDYPERSPGSVRDLVALVFNDVNRFTRESGDLPKLARFHFRYAAKDEVGGCVFQDIQIGNGAQGYRHVRFWFGANFGGISFDYRSLEVHRRGSRVVQVEKDFFYFDIVSNKEFDFYNPFPRLM